MKTFKLNKLVMLLIGFAVFTACVQDDDFDTPDTAVVEPVLDGQTIEISSVAGALAQEQGGSEIDFDDDEARVSYGFDGPIQYLSGYVVSSDEAGNYFEELILQDSPENPTVGVRVLVDVNPLFTRYEPGRKIFVKLNGLVAGISNGVLTVGPQDGDRIGKIPAAVETEFIKRSAELATLVPMPLMISEFTNDKTNLYIQLQDVQFNRNQALGENALSFASEGSDQFDGERILESCASASSTIFSTSTFADFKGLTLPSGRGSMNAVLSKNFFGDTFNIVVNSPTDIMFDSAERCDPDFVECTGASGGGAVFYSENFEGFAGYDAEGWDNINVSGGNRDWIIGSFSGSSYAQITGFNAGEDEIDVYLVTPAIDMDSTTGEELTFEVQANFDNGNILSVLIADDYTGDPTTATWRPLDVSIPSGPTSGFGSFQSVGPVNLDCITGTVNIAFFYEGSDPSATTRYHVDNIEITGN
ncbi:DUF5689 domain-containing protein [Winogradskyella maritima]|uniref:DUF5689 domain-containing protein n=1 Tax=Winogradskyella maritima TaxID=1517766 RepID=A0ABV8AEN3_9FLAO|nr:DUF5689 domain-containing protein [Winogradskyella maritima]